MTPESRMRPLLANGSLTHVSVTKSRNSPLLANGSLTYISAATNENIITEELYDMVTYIRFVPKL
jgi:hypothetical protein